MTYLGRILKNSTCFLLALTLLCCYEPQEGCLDADATNFALEADEDCCTSADECCCEYPQLSLSLKHKMADANLSFDEVYLDKAGNPFRINSIHFFTSNIQFIGEQIHGVTDSISINDNAGSSVLRPDDVTVVSAQTFSFPVGTFKRSGSYSAVRFIVGLNEPELSSPGDQFGSDHPLSYSDETLIDDQGNRIMARITLMTDTISMQIRDLEIPGSNSVAVELPVDLFVPRAAGIALPIGVEYQLWFGDLDVLGDSDSILIAKIVAGIPASMSIL